MSIELPRRSNMSTTTIRVSEQTHEALRALSASTGEPMARLVERAVEHLRAEEFFTELDDAYDRLRADPAALESELEERKAWEATLMDGIDGDQE
jgi:predicted DNA-binding protein